MSLTSNTKIQGLISSGHFGQVFHGEDDVHGKVAIKIPARLPTESDAQWKSRRDDLLKEGQRLKSATHRNVVQVHQILKNGTTDDLLLVMEYCSGGSVFEQYKKGPIPLSTLKRYVTDVSLGLQAIHAKNMLHRDIKPANILLDGKGRAKVGDFGLVTDEIVCGYASQCGYRSHIAYEVWNGSGTSVRSDIWALGMTIYRLLHGEEWYERCPRKDAQQGGFVDSLRWLPHIPPPWRRFVRKMLRDDKAERYQSMDQVLSAMAHLSTSPDFTCVTSPTKVKWNKETSTRKISVVWHFGSQKQQTWKAWSEPRKGAGRIRNLGSSGGAVNGKSAEAGLRQVFLGL